MLLELALETWDPADGKGIDDLLSSGKSPRVIDDPDEIDAVITSYITSSGATAPAADGDGWPAGDQADGPALMVNEADDDPAKLARGYRDAECKHTDGLTLHYYRDEPHRWIAQRSAYEILPEKELRAALAIFAKAELDRANLHALKMHALSGSDSPPPVAKKVTSRLTADIAHHLHGMTLIPSRIEAPAWIGGEGPFPADEVLACRNKLVHLPSLVAGNKDHFVPPTPRFFSPTALDLDFSLDAPAPVAWRSFLDRLWPSDGQSIATLQEWIGYLLSLDTRQQKILLLVGPKRSGKGTIARVIGGLIGRANVAGPTLGSLGMNFGLWPLLGKSVAIISDARLSGRTDAAVVTERLLSISGEDSITVDRKNLSPVTVKLSARFMVMTNELPRLGDSSGALAGRMILLHLTQSWYGQENTALTDQLLTELPGILLWAIAGWQRLRERGYFIQPDAAKELLGDMEDLSSPVGAFIRERCRTGPACEIERSLLFDSWSQWCKSEGKDHPGDSATFGRNLRAAVPAIGGGQQRTDDGDRIRVYRGICLK